MRCHAIRPGRNSSMAFVSRLWESASSSACQWKIPVMPAGSSRKPLRRQNLTNCRSSEQLLRFQIAEPSPCDRHRLFRPLQLIRSQDPLHRRISLQAQLPSGAWPIERPARPVPAEFASTFGAAISPRATRHLFSASSCADETRADWIAEMTTSPITPATMPPPVRGTITCA
jgi:hypothetical protein